MLSRSLAPVITTLSLSSALVSAAWGSPWQVVARFDPDQPTAIKILNRTPYPLEYGLSDPYPATLTEVQSGQALQLEAVAIPNCLALNTPMLSPVQYEVETSPPPSGSNLITVTVTTVNDVSGDHCLDLQSSGAIFVY